MFQQDFLSVLATISNYLGSKSNKGTRKIGVFTIFLVVGFVTMLKSAVDVAPIAFLKVA